MKILADTQKRMEYIHSLQDTICMNYRKMTQQEETLEDKVCRHTSENDAINGHIVVVQLSFVHYFRTLQLFDHISVVAFFFTLQCVCVCLRSIFRCWPRGIALLPS